MHTPGVKRFGVKLTAQIFPEKDDRYEFTVAALGVVEPVVRSPWCWDSAVPPLDMFKWALE